MSDTFRLSATGRTAVRRAISNHADWNAEFRQRTGFNLASMSSREILICAERLGLDFKSIANGADRDTNAPKVAAAAAAFDDAPAVSPIKHAATPASDMSRADELAWQEENKRLANIARAKDARAAADDAERITGANSRETERARAAADNVDGTDRFSRLARMLADLTATTVDEEMVRQIVATEVAAAMSGATPTVRIELMSNGATVGTVDGHKHPEFSKLLRAASARDVSGFAPNVWIAGPAGSGKTYAVAQVAKALDVPFHFNGAIGMAHELLGFVDGRGNYHRTAFREAYENGGCYLFDEVDGSDNAALLALNAALANGTATFPDAVITRHKDCRIFAAANTWGFGGTSDYVGRSKLDAAFLSRFPVRLTWNYDNDLEQAICGHAGFALRVQGARAKAKAAGLKILITPRDSIAGAALIAAGFSLNDAAEMTYCASISPEQRRMIGE